MRKLRSILAAVMAVMLILTAVPFAASASASTDGFTDFPTGWSYAAMTEAVNNGLLTGFGDGTIRPRDHLTRAQMAAIINRAFGAEIKADIAGKFADVNPGDWFYDDIAKAVNMKTFGGDDAGHMRPNDPITREDALVVIARALVVSSMGTERLYQYTDRNTIDGYAEEAVCAFLDRNYIQGYGDGTLRGRNYITREEFAQIMDNIFAAYVRVGGEIVLGNSKGEVIITGDNIGAGDTVRLSSTYIDGDLIIGDGLSTADIIIENVEVSGRILLRGGEGTVTFKNVKLGTLIVTNDVNGTVNFMHYSDEALFKNAVYNTPATFLDRTVEGGTASGTGRLNHDTTRVGNEDAATGPKDKEKDQPIHVTPGGSSTIYYTVAFYDDANGKLITGYRYNVRSGSTLSASKFPSTFPAKDGYEAKYWCYKDGNTEKEFTSSVVIRKDIKVYPHYEPITYTVTFDPDNGEAKIEKKVSYNGKLAEADFPSKPTKDGFDFGGWFYTVSEGGVDVEKEFTADTVVSKDLDVKAKWTKIHTVKFDPDNGEATVTVKVKDGEKLGEKFPSNPKKEGFNFEGWFYTVNESGVDVEKKLEADTIIEGDISAKAKWTVATFTVTFINGTDRDERTNIPYGTKITPPTPADVPGQTFLGWFYTKDGVEEKFTSETEVKSIIEAYARWEGTKYTVTFDPDNGEVKIVVADVAYNATVALPAEPKKTGYTFGGWFYTEGGIEKEFTAATRVTGILEVKAKWTVATFTVTFINGTDRDERTDIPYGTKITPPTPADVPGQTFLGWFYTKDGVEKEFTSETEVKSDIEAYARWEGAKYTVTFDPDNGEAKIVVADVAYNATVALPAKPKKTGYTFGGWFYTEGGVEKEFTAATRVTGILEVKAKWNVAFTVRFWEVYDKVYTVESVASGGKLSDADITAATDRLSDKTADGYVADKTNITDTYDKDVKHTIPGDWYYKDGGEWKKFDSTVAVTGDMDVYYMFTYLKVHLNLQSYLGTIGNIAVDVPYSAETSAHESLLDGLYLATGSASAALNTAVKKSYGKTIKALGASYTPISESGKLNLFEYDYRLIDLLGEATIRRYTEEAIEDMVLHDKALLVEGVKTIASKLNDVGSSEYATVSDYLKQSDGKALLMEFMSDNTDFWVNYLVDTSEGQDILIPFLTQLIPGASEADLRALIANDPDSVKDRIVANKDKCIQYLAGDDTRFSTMVNKACETIGNSSNGALRSEFADKAADAIQKSADKDEKFVENVVQVASDAYESKIDEFINSLKHEETFLVDADRKFIILAISKKLSATTYEEIKAKLPSAASKILDDDVMKEIFDTTLTNYRAQVDSVKNIVTAEDYDGTPQYVDTFCHITIDPVEQVLIPEYNRFFVNKLDPAIKDNKYYTQNAYIREIEQLLKVESILDKKTDGYYVLTGDQYYSLLYKLAVLATDAGDWFVENVPEEELDDAIKAAETRIGGYLDRLIAKVTFLQNGKVDDARKRGEELVRKLIDKNNSELWNTKTEVAFTEKLPTAYDKAKELVYDKFGFDVDKTIIVTIGSDNETVTATDGVKTVTKSLSDLLKQYADGKKGITVNGTVITVKGRSFDAKKIAEKLTAKFGSTFTVKVEKADCVAENVDNPEGGYKLSVNSDYVLIQKLKI